MKQWVNYYLWSFFIILMIEIVPALLMFMLMFMPGPGRLMLSVIFLWKYILVAAILILQLIILYLNKTRDGIRLKFFTAFSCLYSLVYVIAYAQHVHSKYEFQDVIDPVSEGSHNPFIGGHTWFIVPLILQIVIFILLYRKKMRATSETSS